MPDGRALFQRVRCREHTRAGFGWSFAKDAEEAGAQAAKQAVASMGTPGLAIAYCTAGYDARALLNGLNQALPGVPVLGGTSMKGIATPEGFKSGNGGVVGVLALSSPAWRFQVAGAPLGGSPVEAGRIAAEHAKVNGRLPHAYLMAVTAGEEEAVLRGIARAAPAVPVIGGSAAFDSEPQCARVFSNAESYQSGVVLAGILSELPLGCATGCGYHASSKRGRVTRAEGRRIYEIDGRPAAEVYVEWAGFTSGAVTGTELAVASVSMPLGHLDPASGFPIARHPVRIHEDGSLSTGAISQTGEELILLHATVDDLLAEVGRVVRTAMSRAGLRKGEVSAVYLVHCAGRLGYILPRADEITRQIVEAAGQVPFLGHFSFGEQGYLTSRVNAHGNLLLSALVLGT